MWVVLTSIQQGQIVTLCNGNQKDINGVEPTQHLRSRIVSAPRREHFPQISWFCLEIDENSLVMPNILFSENVKPWWASIYDTYSVYNCKLTVAVLQVTRIFTTPRCRPGRCRACCRPTPRSAGQCRGCLRQLSRSQSRDRNSGAEGAGTSGETEGGREGARGSEYAWTSHCLS